MSSYWEILESVKGRLETIPALADLSIPIRPQIAYRPNVDTSLPLVVIAPRKDLWEKIPELQFSDGAFVEYSVLVALIQENAFDQANLRWQLDRRDEIRRKLFVTSLPGVESVFDCQYDPSPRGVSLEGLKPNLDVSVQQFTYRTSETRSS